MKRASTGKTSHAKTTRASPRGHTDWKRVRAQTDVDIHHDVDSPRTTANDWTGAVIKKGGKAIGVVRRRGPQKSPTKISATLRLSPEVVAYFKADGLGWQTRIDNALRKIAGVR
jgi:uncharacterized protein (DUF4415 family)